MMGLSSLLPLAVSSLYAAYASAQSTSDVCESYGIDFQSGGSYFINTASNDSFTAVSEFSGCQNDTAQIMLVDPNGTSYECSNVPTQPDYTPEMTTCPIQKSQMFSGEWTLVVLGNNGDAAPFDYQRSFYLDCGAQTTVTVLPTLTYNVTAPASTVTATNTSTIYTTDTVPATTTVTIPASTHFYTVTPRATTTTSFHTVTRTYTRYSHTKTIVNTTVQPSCTVPPRQPTPDPWCSFRPQGVQLPTWFSTTPPSRKRDETLAAGAQRARFEAIKARQEAAAPHVVREANAFEKRSADPSVVTVTATTPIVSTTVTITSAPATAYSLVLETDTAYTTLPPSTVHRGVARSTITASQSTKTIVKATYTATTVTKTNTATLTHTSTVSPTASVSACKHRGGHFGGGWRSFY